MHENPVTRARPAFSAGVLFTGAALTLVGCVSADPAARTATTAAAKAPIYERSDSRTGSNLPKKANKPSNVLVVDPEMMQGAARGATRNSSTGP